MYGFTKFSTFKLGNKERFDKEQIGIKWRILSQPGKKGSGKNIFF